LRANCGITEDIDVNRSPDVDGYLARQPAPVRGRLAQIRRLVRTAAPKATEGMSYRIPAWRQHNIIVYLAGFRNHIGLFPPVRGNAALEKALKKYANPKGNLKFPHDAPLPLPLIARVVRHQARQDAARVAARRRKAR
jgi:uncharacterized protein YdhG (YjbR/CyaY superfamily)